MQVIFEVPDGATPFLQFRLDRMFEAADLSTPETRGHAANAAVAIIAEHAPSASELPIEDVIGAPSVQAEVCEAIIGAVFEQFGYDETAGPVTEAFAAEIVDAEADPGDAKSALQEFLARRGDRPAYLMIEADGPPHDRRFTCAVEIRGDRYGTGTGRSKKEAEQSAAEATLALLGSPN